MCLKKFNEFGKNQNKINESTEDKPMVKNQLENMIENINEFLGYLPLGGRPASLGPR